MNQYKSIELQSGPLPGSGAASEVQLIPQPVMAPVISKEELLRIAKEVGVALDESAMSALTDIADDFVDSVTVFAAELAKHRAEKAGEDIVTLTTKDLKRKSKVVFPFFFFSFFFLFNSSFGDQLEAEGASARRRRRECAKES